MKMCKRLSLPFGPAEERKDLSVGAAEGSLIAAATAAPWRA